MFICICNSVTDNEVHAAIQAGANSLSKLQECLGVATQCGKCACAATEILQQYQASANAQNDIVACDSIQSERE